MPLNVRASPGEAALPLDPPRGPGEAAPAARSRARGGGRDFVIDTAVVAVTKVLLKLRGVVTLPLIVKLLGTAEYGRWSQLLALVGLVSAALSANLHLPLVRFVAGEAHPRRVVYSTTLVATLALALAGGGLMLAFSGPVGFLLLGEGEYAREIAICALLVLFGNVRLMGLSLYRATERLKLRSVVELVVTLGELVGICAVIALGGGLLGALVFMAAWEGVFAVAIVAHTVRLTGWARPRLAVGREIFAYALPLLPAVLSVWVLDRVDRLVIGVYLGPGAVGIYSAVYAVAGMLMLAQAPFQMTLMPRVARLWDSEPETVRRYISLSNRVFLTFAIPFSFGCAVLARPLLAWLANAEIAAGSGVNTLILSLGITLWGVGIMQTQVFHGARRPGVIGVVTLFASILNLGLNLVLVPRMGITGAALATLVAYACVSAAFYRLGRSLLVIDFYPRYLAKCVAASLGMSAVVWRMGAEGPLGLLLAGTAGALVYVALLVVLRAVGRRELEWMRQWRRPAAAAPARD